MSAGVPNNGQYPPGYIAGRVPDANGWRDIADAPRDGTEFDVWRDGVRFIECSYVKGVLRHEAWRQSGGGMFDPQPTHWRRPPAPPVSA